MTHVWTQIFPQNLVNSRTETASRMRDEMVAIPAGPSESSSSAAAVDAQQPQQPLIISQARRFERLRGRPEKSGDPEVAEWVADMRYHLACNRMPKTTACALIMEHLKGKARIEISGRDIRDDPEAIFRALLQAFGDGSDLASLQERLFQCRQARGESVVDCSLKLVDLYSKITERDPAYVSRRDQTLKERLAAAVTDHSVSREVRRLIREAPQLDFFQLRDRVVDWAGGDQPAVVRVVSQEAAAMPDGIAEFLKRQEAMMQAQNKQIGDLAAAVQSLQGRDRRQRHDGPRLCWACGSADHMRRNCPTEQARAGGNNRASKSDFR